MLSDCWNETLQYFHDVFLTFSLEIFVTILNTVFQNFKK